MSCKILEEKWRYVRIFCKNISDLPSLLKNILERYKSNRIVVAPWNYIYYHIFRGCLDLSLEDPVMISLENMSLEDSIRTLKELGFNAISFEEFLKEKDSRFSKYLSIYELWKNKRKATFFTVIASLYYFFSRYRNFEVKISEGVSYAVVKDKKIVLGLKRDDPLASLLHEGAHIEAYEKKEDYKDNPLTDSLTDILDKLEISELARNALAEEISMRLLMEGIKKRYIDKERFSTYNILLKEIIYLCLFHEDSLIFISNSTLRALREKIYKFTDNFLKRRNSLVVNYEIIKEYIDYLVEEVEKLEAYKEILKKFKEVPEII